MHVNGYNSAYFYLAGLIHPRLRTLLLPRQLANKKGFELELTFGKPVLAQELRLLKKPRAVTEYLRVSTEALSSRREAAPERFARKVAEILPTATGSESAAESAARSWRGSPNSR